jgi:hypothetical protein
LQKGFDEFACAANRHAGKSFELFSSRHFRLGVEPFGQQAELVGGHVPGFDSVKQMRKQGPGKMAARNAGHGLIAVEAVGQRGFQFFNFGGVVGINHALGKSGKFIPRQPARTRQFDGELDNV